MTLQSMTGFARAEEAGEDVTVAWELRSVNGRGLEARLHQKKSMETWRSRSTSATAVSLPVSLASACRDENRFEFFFAALPWRMKGVTLSASNPVAVF